MAKAPTKKALAEQARAALGPGLKVERDDTPFEAALKEHQKAWVKLLRAAEVERVPADVRNAAAQIVGFSCDALRWGWDRHMLVAWGRAKPKLNPKRTRERQMRAVIAVCADLLQPKYPTTAATQLQVITGVLGGMIDAKFKSITGAQLQQILAGFVGKKRDPRRLAAELTCAVGAFRYARDNEAALVLAIKRFGSFT